MSSAATCIDLRACSVSLNNFLSLIACTFQSPPWLVYVYRDGSDFRCSLLSRSGDPPSNNYNNDIYILHGHQHHWISSSCVATVHNSQKNHLLELAHEAVGANKMLKYTKIAQFSLVSSSSGLMMRNSLHHSVGELLYKELWRSSVIKSEPDSQPETCPKQIKDDLIP